MGKGIGDDPALALLLQAIVTDGIGGVQRILQVAFLEPVMALLCVVGPDTGKAVGLQLLAHQQAVVAFHPCAALTRRLHLQGYAQQGLHVMADFVGDYVGLGEIAGHLEA